MSLKSSDIHAQPTSINPLSDEFWDDRTVLSDLPFYPAMDPVYKPESLQPEPVIDITDDGYFTDGMSVEVVMSDGRYLIGSPATDQAA